MRFETCYRLLIIGVLHFVSYPRVVSNPSALRTIIEEYCDEAITKIASAAKDMTKGILRQNTFSTCFFRKALVSHTDSTRILEAMLGLLPCSVLLDKVQNERQSDDTFALSGPSSSESLTLEHDDVTPTTTHIMCYRVSLLTADGSIGVVPAESDVLVVLYARLANVSDDTYAVYLERQQLGASNKNFPRIAAQPHYRRLPQLNLQMPADFFYPFSCSAAASAFVSFGATFVIVLANVALNCAFQLIYSSLIKYFE